MHVVVSIRADFFDRPLAHPALGPLVAAGSFGVTPDERTAELHDAVVLPAATVGVVFEPGLESAIVAEVANQPASLPLLQFTLAELFERRRGGVIIRKPPTNRWAASPAPSPAGPRSSTRRSTSPVRTAARRLLLRLVVPGDGTEATRRRVRYGELPPGSAAVAARFDDAPPPRRRP